jgi:ComF family protein
LISGSRDHHLDGCYALADYHGAMRRVLHRLKYERALKYDAACRNLLEQFPWPQRLAPVNLVVPVPLSAQRLAQRGFNQTEAIFRPWAEANWLWQDALERIRPTEAQWSLSRQERIMNLKRAFRVKDSFCVTHKHILLVDDIYTTGVTLDECAAALKRKGAASVTGLVMASGAV